MNEKIRIPRLEHNDRLNEHVETEIARMQMNIQNLEKILGEPKTEKVAGRQKGDIERLTATANKLIIAGAVIAGIPMVAEIVAPDKVEPIANAAYHFLFDEHFPELAGVLAILMSAMGVATFREEIKNFFQGGKRKDGLK